MNEIWAVIPAAGVGKRMQADRPKQYLEIANKTVLQHTIERIASHAEIAGVVVAISPGDEYWQDVNLPEGKHIVRVDGGKERCHSVQNGLRYLLDNGHSQAWALVHDAARPCVRIEDIDKLIKGVVGTHPGGILGLPVSDTIKLCSDAQDIEKTVDREGLWRALTPQLFKVTQLFEAIEKSLNDGYLVTDESSAMEHIGHKPKIVEGHPDNIKITRPQDLVLAGLFLQQQEEI